jgi:hypothetical protein
LFAHNKKRSREISYGSFEFCNFTEQQHKNSNNTRTQNPEIYFLLTQIKIERSRSILRSKSRDQFFIRSLSSKPSNFHQIHNNKAVIGTKSVKTNSISRTLKKRDCYWNKAVWRWVTRDFCYEIEKRDWSCIVKRRREVFFLTRKRDCCYGGNVDVTHWYGDLYLKEHWRRELENCFLNLLWRFHHCWSLKVFGFVFFGRTLKLLLFMFCCFFCCEVNERKLKEWFMQYEGFNGLS